jgi:hypothetical protein
MKKLICAIFALVLMLSLFTWTAMAVEVIEVAADVAQGVGAIEEIEQSGLPTEPFTWAALGTIAGCTAFALLFVQLIKAPLDKVWHIPTRLVVYVVCLIVMLLSAAFGEGGLTVQTGLLAAVNAVIPTLAAMGAYEMTFGRKK